MKTDKKEKVKSRIKKGDTVVFIAGREYNRYDANGKRNPFRGQVIAVDPRKGKVKVEGAVIVKKHQRAVPQMNKEGGILEREAWVDISNVALLDPKNGKPTRVRYEVRDGKKVRVAGSGEIIGTKPRTEKAGKEKTGKKASNDFGTSDAPEKPEKKKTTKKADKKSE